VIQLPGQMTVDDCIAVAESGADGFWAPQAPLDLHEGIDDPPRIPARVLTHSAVDGTELWEPVVDWIADPRTGCPRWPAGLLLRWQSGQLSGFVPGRCGATNLCAYCQRLYVVETVEMLTLDAMEHAPTLWLVLTAREHLTRADCRRHLVQLRRAARKRWPEIQWFVQVEFQRRGALHLNLLVKGVSADEREQLHELTCERWCDRVDALPQGQWSGVVGDGVGVVRYISKMLAHGLKAEQAPPIGWRGHRTSQTRGYLVRPAAEMRLEARAALRLKRKLRKVAQLAPELDAESLLEVAEGLVQSDAQKLWTLLAVNPLVAERLLAG
jgi:hypothetical protein